MTCKACGRDVPLEDINCFDCNAEGPFTWALRLAPWQRRFAWLPTRISSELIWLRWYEAKEYAAFGYPQRTTRLAIADRNPQGGDVKQAPSRSDESGGADRQSHNPSSSTQTG